MQHKSDHVFTSEKHAKGKYTEGIRKEGCVELELLQARKLEYKDSEKAIREKKKRVARNV